MIPTSTGLMPFAFEESLVRIRQDAQGAPWFVAKDVCTVLGLSNVTEATRSLEDDERGSVILNTLGGEQEMLTVSESGLYSLIFRSRKPEARVFRKWVTSEVLPTLRKTGSYGTPKGTPEIDLAAIGRLPVGIKKTVLAIAAKELGALSRAHRDMAPDFANQLLTLSTAFAYEQPDSDEPEAARLFWQLWPALGKEHNLNHSRNADLIALRLPETAAAAHAAGLPFTLTELRAVLPKSRTYRCLGAGRAVNSLHFGKTVRCMVFYTPQPQQYPEVCS